MHIPFRDFIEHPVARCLSGPSTRRLVDVGLKVRSKGYTFYFMILIHCVEMDALFEDAPLFVPRSSYVKVHNRHEAENQLRSGESSVTIASSLRLMLLTQAPSLPESSPRRLQIAVSIMNRRMRKSLCSYNTLNTFTNCLHLVKRDAVSV